MKKKEQTSGKKENNGGKTIKELEQELEKCREERKEYLSGWKRARADLLNYKKQELQRMELFSKGCLEDFIIELLPFLDDLERAEERLPQSLKEEAGVKGLVQIKKKLKDLLEKKGLKEIEVLGQEFDPEYAEAVEVVPGGEEERVVEVIEKGYSLQDKVIRPAKVVVAAGDQNTDDRSNNGRDGNGD